MALDKEKANDLILEAYDSLCHKMGPDGTWKHDRVRGIDRVARMLVKNDLAQLEAAKLVVSLLVHQYRPTMEGTQ
jgi:hypothetical protein